MIADSRPGKYRTFAFLCGTRDYHAMDWFRSARNLVEPDRLVVLTDIRGGEGFTDLAQPGDTVVNLVVIDRYLLDGQSRFGSLWRNLLKFAIFPIQAMLVRRFARQHPNTLFFAHSMYYLWLAWAAGVVFVGTPQGSDLLVKPWKSRLFHYLSAKAMKAAKLVTVDSEAMAEAALKIADVRCALVQNGVSITEIQNRVSETAMGSNVRSSVVSPRAITPLYRIADIISARNRMSGHAPDLCLLYPFSESEYLGKCRTQCTERDLDLGRVDRKRMYQIFSEARLVISIPSSDSSPRSVYEAIFCGAPVAICHNRYYDILPDDMKSRIILIDLDNPEWFETALKAADLLIRSEPDFSEATWDMFDQRASLRKIMELAAQ